MRWSCGLVAAVMPARRAAAPRSRAGDPDVSRGPSSSSPDIRKTYNEGTEVEVEVLHGVDLALHEGEFAA